MSTDLRQSVLDYIKNMADSEFLKMVYSLAEEYQEEKRISLGQYNKEIDESIAQIEKGEIYTHQEMELRIRRIIATNSELINGF